MVGSDEIMEALLHLFAITDVARSAQNVRCQFPCGARHYPQCRLEPDIMLIDMSQPIADCSRGPGLHDLTESGTNDIELLRVDEFEQRMTDKLGMGYAQDVIGYG